ncbi:MAG: hypothetical protein RIS38_176 [Verrucomicrobiota bacterium]|jgi:hypothetical protein
MPRLYALLLLLVGPASLSAQWQIFAEKLPASGAWATYRMETIREGRTASTSELRFSVRPGREVDGKSHVWFTVEPVMWLGSHERAPLRLLVRPDMDRAAASRLIENSAEIVFSNPVKGPYHMTRADIAWVSDWAKLTYTSELTPDEPAKEEVVAAGRGFACERLRMVASTTTDPPMVSKQVLEFRGQVWRSEEAAFGVVRAEWEERTTKGSKIKSETKRLTLLAQGKETPPAEPVDRGRDFSVWRLIFGR